MSPVNTAAWLKAKAAPLEITSAPYPVPGENEIVIKNGAIALQLVDWAIQVMGHGLFPWLNFPTILGSDVAGEVVEVGPSTTPSRFKPGDRIVGLAVGLALNDNAQRACQTYTLLKSHMAAPIPDSMSYSNAAVLPLGLSTAACGLFQKDHLALQYPTVPPRPTGEALLVWGGASSVGCNGVQLAVAAGYEVFTTSSPKNFELMKSLGASKVFDYKSDTVVADFIAAFKDSGKKCAGALSIGPENAWKVVEIVDKAMEGVEGRKFISMANPVPEGLKLPEGISTKFIFGSDLWKNEVGVKVWDEFLGEALKVGSYVAAPEAEIVGTGLEFVEKAFEIGKKGVSAKKLVVLL